MENPGKERTVLLQEVGPRDGLQNEPMTLRAEVRAELIDQLAETGLPRIQIGSFVNPVKVPQMAGTDRIWGLINESDQIRYSVLVLNERGLLDAAAAGVGHVEVYVSASETHSMKNSNASVERSTAAAGRMVQRAHEQGLTVTAGVMCAFGCFYEGPVPTERVLEILDRFAEQRPVEFGLADTTGMADPEGVRRMIRILSKRIDLDQMALHLHDTRGMGLANLSAALQMGVRRFDSSVGALGGCPFIPGAKGNVSTERAVEIIESMGFETGVDLDAVLRIRKKLGDLLGKDLPIETVDPERPHRP